MRDEEDGMPYPSLLMHVFSGDRSRRWWSEATRFTASLLLHPDVFILSCRVARTHLGMVGRSEWGISMGRRFASVWCQMEWCGVWRCVAYVVGFVEADESCETTFEIYDFLSGGGYLHPEADVEGFPC